MGQTSFQTFLPFKSIIANYINIVWNLPLIVLRINLFEIQLYFKAWKVQK